MLSTEVVDYLKGLDINILSINEIIGKLSETFGSDFSDKKEEIEAILMDMHMSAESQDEEIDDFELARRLQNEEKRRSRRLKVNKRTKNKRDKSVRRRGLTMFNRPLCVSDTLRKMILVDSCSRPDAVKLLWKYIKEHGLQDPNDKRYIISDDLMLKAFKKKRISCFGLNRELTKHLRPMDEQNVDPAPIGT